MVLYSKRLKPFGIVSTMIELGTVKICVRLRAALFENKKPLQVHSVFTSAVNIIGQDIFFSLLSSRHCLFPMSCMVSNMNSFKEYDLKEGMEVMVSEDGIFIPGANLLASLSNCKEQDLTFGNKITLFVPKDLSHKVEILKGLIEAKGSEIDFSTLITKKFRNPYADFIMKKLPEFNERIKKIDFRKSKSLRRNEIEQLGRIVEGIAGCGIGLTPSSDDMLVGYMSSYLADSIAKGYNRQEVYEVTSALGNEAYKRTNTISGAFLKQCGMGLLSEDMSKLMHTIYSDSDREMVKIQGQRIQNFGSTSGTDMLTGVVLAIVNLNGGDKFG